MKNIALWISAAIEIPSGSIQEILTQYLKNTSKSINFMIFVDVFFVIVFISLLIILLMRLINYVNVDKSMKGVGKRNLISYSALLILSITYILTRFFIVTTTNESESRETATTSSTITYEIPTNTLTIAPSSTSTLGTTPTVTSSLTTTLAEIPSPMPSLTITPKPTDGWDFKTGCISSEWAYWPKSWIYKLDNIDYEECLDYSYFGLDAKTNVGLYIAYSKPDGNIKFGMSRKIPEGFTQFMYHIELTNFFAGDPTTNFVIGLIDTDSTPMTGQYFTIQREQGTEEALCLYASCPGVSNPACKYIGFINELGEKEIQVNCSIISSNKISCTYTWDNQEQTIDHYQHIEWDSLYIGYEIPKDGTIDLLITDLIVE